jgi:hypothetical protein
MAYFMPTLPQVTGGVGYTVRTVVVLRLTVVVTHMDAADPESVVRVTKLVDRPGVWTKTVAINDEMMVTVVVDAPVQAAVENLVDVTVLGIVQAENPA